jgi:hypothetical protein
MVLAAKVVRELTRWIKRHGTVAAFPALLFVLMLHRHGDRLLCFFRFRPRSVPGRILWPVYVSKKYDTGAKPIKPRCLVAIS